MGAIRAAAGNGLLSEPNKSLTFQFSSKDINLHEYVAANPGKLYSMQPWSEFVPTHGITKSKGRLRKLILELKANGIRESIKYIEHEGVKYIVNGHHRILAARHLGLDIIPVEKVPLPCLGYKTAEDLMYHGSWF